MIKKIQFYHIFLLTEGENKNQDFESITCNYYCLCMKIPHGKLFQNFIFF